MGLQQEEGDRQEGGMEDKERGTSAEEEDKEDQLKIMFLFKH
jgi:hypothetical protein